MRDLATDINATNWTVKEYPKVIAISGPSWQICEMNMTWYEQYKALGDHEAASAEYAFVKGLAQMICDSVNNRGAAKEMLAEYLNTGKLVGWGHVNAHPRA